MIARHRSFGVPASQIVRIGLYLISVGVFLGNETAYRTLRPNSIICCALPAIQKNWLMSWRRTDFQKIFPGYRREKTLKEFCVSAKEYL